MQMIVQYHDVPRDFLPRNPSLSQLLPGEVSVLQSDQTSMYIEIETGYWAGFQIRLFGDDFTYLGGIPIGGEIGRLELHAGELGKTLDIVAQTDEGASRNTGVALATFWEKIRDGDSLSAQQLFQVRGLVITGSDGHDNIMDWRGLSSYHHMNVDGDDRNDIPDLNAGAGDDYLSNIVWNNQNLGYGYVFLGDGNDTVSGVTGYVLGEDGNDTFHDVGSNGNMGSFVQAYQGGEGDDVFLMDTASYFVYANGGNGFDRVEALAPRGQFLSLGSNMESYSVAARYGNQVVMPISPGIQYAAKAPGTILKGKGGAGDYSSLQLEGFADVEMSFTLGSGGSLVATGFDDTVSGGSDGTIHLGGGDDFFFGGERNVVFGGTGDDIFEIETWQPLGGNSIHGDEGTDTLRFSGQAAINLDMQSAGEAGMLSNIERVETGAGNDAVSGDEFGNIFALGQGLNELDGRGGNDRVDYSGETGRITAALQGSTATWITVGGVERDYVRNIESIVAGSANDILTGDGAANIFFGGLGNDRLSGMGGNDWITPGLGNDSIDGGDGIDMASFSDHSRAIIVDLAALTVWSGLDVNQISNIENVTGSIYSDFFTGDAGDNWFRGLGGYDWFIASAGEDTYDGSNGRDMVTYINASAGVTVDLGQQRGIAGEAATHTYVEVERATGSIHADVFYGSDGSDEFRGAGGYDVFYDSEGRDRYDGGTGLDTVDYSRSAGGVNASLLRGSGGPNYDLYLSIENLNGSRRDDALTGDHGRNVLRGWHGDDALNGMGGNDYLEGGSGNDVMDGGAGYDVALYRNAASQYTVSTVGDVTTVTHAVDGIDTLTNIEALRFTDGFDYL